MGPSPNYADSGYNTPNSLRSTYNITNSGYTGAGARVGIVFWSAPIQSDLNLWQNYFGHALNISIIGNSTPNSDADEADLDVQLVHTAAPNAAIRFYVAAHPSDADLITATSTAINDNIQVLTNSWGSCEPSISQSTISAFHNLYTTAVARGIAVFASSGDSGVFECQNTGGTPLAGYASYPAADYFVTAVGGTRLIRENSNDTWLGETGWNCPVTGGSNDNSCSAAFNGGSGGGGISYYFPRPDYQSSITPPYASKFVYNPPSQMRVIPDISMDADPNSGPLFYYNGQLYYAGGTSASSPLLAGITALAVQRAGGPVGNINSFIYSNNQAANWRFDITTGYNGVYAASNWDYVTGLGSIKDVRSFLKAFIAFPTNLSLQVNSNPVPYGSPVTFNATITSNGRGTPSGNIYFYEDSSLLGAAPISNNGTASLTVDSLSAGTHNNIYARFESDGNFNSSSSDPLTLIVDKPGVNLEVSANSILVVVGNPVTMTARVSPQLQNLNLPLPGGTLTFKDYDNVLATLTVPENGVVDYSSSSLNPGRHEITVVYSGDATFAPATSNKIVETIKVIQTLFTVTRAADQGAELDGDTEGTFSYALKRANSGDAITFDGVGIIQVTGQLPPVKNGVWLKGWCGPGGPAVILDGLLAPVNINGLTLEGNNSISGIETSGFKGSQLVLAGPGNGFWCSSNKVGGEGGLTLADETGVNLALSDNPVAFGTSLIITAEVKPLLSEAGIPTGSVDFYEGSNLLGSSSISFSSGNSASAKVTLSSLSTGNHSIRATYSGDSNFKQSYSPPKNLVIGKAETVVTLSSSHNPVYQGVPITLTAGISSTTPTNIKPTGTVTFKEGSSIVGTATVNDGIATYMFNSLGADEHTLNAEYSGDSNFIANVSPALSQTVNQATLVGTGSQASCTEATLGAALAHGGKIAFYCGSSPVTITLTSQKTIGVDAVLDGESSITLSGGNTTRLFYINSGFHFGLENINIVNGHLSGAAKGGAIYNDGGILTITNTTFKGNNITVVGTDNQYSYGGAIYNLNGVLDIETSSFISNFMTVGGNCSSTCGVLGSGIFNDGVNSSITISSTTFNQNYSVGTAGFTFLGAVLHSANGVIHVESSTFSNNTANPYTNPDCCNGSMGATAIQNYVGTLSIKNTTFTGNKSVQPDKSRASNQGYSGSIYNSGALTIETSNFSGNDGAIFNNSGGTLNIFGTSFSNNNYDVPSSPYAGGVTNNSGTVKITGSTLNNNSSKGISGAIYNISGGTMSITNSTIDGNTGYFGGGIINGENSSINIYNSTLSDNTDFNGTVAGIVDYAYNTVGITMWNSILYRSSNTPICTNTPIHGGNNIDSGTSCIFSTPSANLNNVDPLLDSLKDNGGPTKTRALLSESPAIRYGNPGVCSAAPVNGVDQRGVIRPLPENTSCDTGAFEKD